MKCTECGINFHAPAVPNSKTMCPKCKHVFTFGSRGQLVRTLPNKRPNAPLSEPLSPVPAAAPGQPCPVMTPPSQQPKKPAPPAPTPSTRKANAVPLSARQMALLRKRRQLAGNVPLTARRNRTPQTFTFPDAPAAEKPSIPTVAPLANPVVTPVNLNDFGKRPDRARTEMDAALFNLPAQAHIDVGPKITEDQSKYIGKVYEEQRRGELSAIEEKLRKEAQQIGQNVKPQVEEKLPDTFRVEDVERNRNAETDMMVRKTLSCIPSNMTAQQILKDFELKETTTESAEAARQRRELERQQNDRMFEMRQRQGNDAVQMQYKVYHEDDEHVDTVYNDRQKYMLQTSNPNLQQQNTQQYSQSQYSQQQYSQTQHAYNPNVNAQQQQYTQSQYTYNPNVYAQQQQPQYSQSQYPQNQYAYNPNVNQHMTQTRPRRRMMRMV